MTLDQLPLSAAATVRGLNEQGDLAHGLLELGIVPGTAIRVIRRAPLGCPLQVDVAGAHLAIRRDVAAVIEIEPVAEPAAV